MLLQKKVDEHLGGLGQGVQSESARAFFLEHGRTASDTAGLPVVTSPAGQLSTDPSTAGISMVEVHVDNGHNDNRLPRA